MVERLLISTVLMLFFSNTVSIDGYETSLENRDIVHSAQELLERWKNQSSLCASTMGIGSESDWSLQCTCIDGFDILEEQCVPNSESEVLLEGFGYLKLPGHVVPCLTVEHCAEMLARRLGPKLVALAACRTQLATMGADWVALGGAAQAEQDRQALRARTLEFQALNLVAMNERLVGELRHGEEAARGNAGRRGSLEALRQRLAEARRKVGALRVKVEEARAAKDRYLVDQTQRLDRCEDAAAGARSTYAEHNLPAPAS